MSTHYPEWYSQNGEDLIVWCSEDIYDAWGLDTELLTSQDEEAQDQGYDLTRRPNGKYIGITLKQLMIEVLLAKESLISNLSME